MPDFAIALSHAAISAVNHVLSSTEPKGRSEIRNHSRIVKILKSDCMEEKEENNQKLTVSKEGSLVLDEDKFKYFKEILKEKITKPIPGVLSTGYTELLDAIDAAEEAVSKKEDKK